LESPLPFLAIGLVAASIVALFAYSAHATRKRASARAHELFLKGAAAAEIVPVLVAEGCPSETAAGVVEATFRRILLAHPTTMLEAGHARADILKDMVGRGIDATHAEEIIGEAATRLWCRRWWFFLVPAGIALCVAGAALAFFGLVLRDGNRTGKWVTFPFAGGVTITAGASVLVMGVVTLAMAFGKGD